VHHDLEKPFGLGVMAAGCMGLSAALNVRLQGGCRIGAYDLIVPLSSAFPPLCRGWLMAAGWHCSTKTPLDERRFFTTGAGGRNRTGDLRITNALLYQLSYAGEKERAL
jgi:hypothetical protein